MKEKYMIDIGGLQLNIASEESEEYLQGLADQINERITEMVMKNKRCSRMDATLFCALEFLDEKHKTDLAMENMRKQVDDYEKDIEDLMRENTELKKLLGHG